MWMLRSRASSLAIGCADAAHALGRLVELLGERQRLFAIELGQKFAVDGDVAVFVWDDVRRCDGTRATGCRVSRLTESDMNCSLLEETRALARGRRLGWGGIDKQMGSQKAGTNGRP